MPESKIIILGSGLTGLTVAYYLKKPFEIYEQDTEPGGLCRSRRKNGFTFDYSGHLLHFKDSSVLNWLKDLTGNNLSCYFKDSSIFSHNRLIRFPFQVNTCKLPPQITKECVLGFIEAQNLYSAQKVSNFQEWLYVTFGKGFTKYFFIPYNNKFWTIPVENLSIDWIDGYIPVPTLEDVIEGSLGESKKVFGYNSQFWYPARGGIENIPLAIARGVKGDIVFKHKASKIDYINKIIEFENGFKKRYKKLVTTVPLVELKDIIFDLPPLVRRAFEKLKYMSVLNLNLGIDKVNVSEKHWIYFPEEKYTFYRIGFYSNFSGNLAPIGTTSMYVEVSYNSQRNIDKEKIKENILKDLMKQEAKFRRKITASDIIAQDLLDIKYGYIIYDNSYKRAMKTINKFLKGNDIYTVGRYGSWKYMSMEDSILDGKELALKLDQM